MAEKANFIRRDRLREMEGKVQKMWAREKLYETNSKEVKDGNKSKFMATFPYPYMNGVLHLGHAFTLVKTEFACRYQALLGKNVLFPFAFHCTGMPIAACATKLDREMKTYGNPPIFPEAKPVASSESPSVAAAPGKKKGKAAKKKSKHKQQWKIMEEMGVPSEEVSRFRDAQHWLHYFPPIGKQHLQQLGLRIDWRRAFITTELNPYYDAFIRWQFFTLRKRAKILFGKRLSVFSPIDNQPCADHDRASGEGKGITDYTCIKLELQKPYPEALAKQLKKGKKVILPAATLRPETMYGQTNLFLLPEGEYGIYSMGRNEVFIQSPRSALNMSYQESTPVAGKPQEIGKILGKELLGCAVKAPLCSYEKVYILPLLTIKMNKGTGVVTSVPSDAPDDYAALMDMKNKKALREKWGITDEMVLPFDVVPILETPGLGTTPAKDLCIEMKVKSQNDAEKLAIIKDRCYMDSFYKGVMLVGKFKGEKVSEAKPKIKQMLIDAKQALAYSEPEATIMSRSGNECVAALTDQWYLTYGEEEWKKLVAEHVDNTLECYNTKTKEKFQYIVGWLREWACSRSFGLGTKLPWDEQFVIESLSDSTIYMAYYTIAHFLQGNTNGTAPGTAGIKPSQLTVPVFDYIYLRGPYPKDCGIAEDVLQKLRAEFEYWYPMDLRVSGKDLIGNHLTMCLYNHAAIWEGRPEMMPRSFFTNGHLMINHEKMSKSTGNFLTLLDAIKQYGSDATRFALADGGDTNQDANFEEPLANSMVLILTKMEDQIMAVYKDLGSLRTGALTFFDEVALNEINKIVGSMQAYYEKMQYHEVAVCIRQLINSRDEYLFVSETVHSKVIQRWTECFLVTLSPFCPHFSQTLWNAIGKAGFVEHAGWPKTEADKPELSEMSSYLRSLKSLLNSEHQKKCKMYKKQNKGFAAEDLDTCTLYVADGFPSWMKQTVETAKKAFEDGGKASFPEVKVGAKLLSKVIKEKRQLGQCMALWNKLGETYAAEGESAFTLSSSIEEQKLLKAQQEYLLAAIPIKQFVIQVVNPDSPPPKGLGKMSAVPQSPMPHFTSSKLA